MMYVFVILGLRNCLVVFVIVIGELRNLLGFFGIQIVGI